MPDNIRGKGKNGRGKDSRRSRLQHARNERSAPIDDRRNNQSQTSNREPLGGPIAANSNKYRSSANYFPEPNYPQSSRASIVFHKDLSIPPLDLSHPPPPLHHPVLRLQDHPPLQARCHFGNGVPRHATSATENGTVRLAYPELCPRISCDRVNRPQTNPVRGLGRRQSMGANRASCPSYAETLMRRQCTPLNQSLAPCARNGPGLSRPNDTSQIGQADLPPSQMITTVERSDYPVISSPRTGILNSITNNPDNIQIGIVNDAFSNLSIAYVEQNKPKTTNTENRNQDEQSKESCRSTHYSQQSLVPSGFMIKHENTKPKTEPKGQANLNLQGELCRSFGCSGTANMPCSPQCSRAAMFIPPNPNNSSLNLNQQIREEMRIAKRMMLPIHFDEADSNEFQSSPVTEAATPNQPQPLQDANGNSFQMVENKGQCFFYPERSALSNLNNVVENNSDEQGKASPAKHDVSSADRDNSRVTIFQADRHASNNENFTNSRTLSQPESSVKTQQNHVSYHSVNERQEYPTSDTTGNGTLQNYSNHFNPAQQLQTAEHFGVSQVLLDYIPPTLPHLVQNESFNSSINQNQSFAGGRNYSSPIDAPHQNIPAFTNRHTNEAFPRTESQPSSFRGFTEGDTNPMINQSSYVNFFERENEIDQPGFLQPMPLPYVVCSPLHPQDRDGFLYQHPSPGSGYSYPITPLYNFPLQSSAPEARRVSIHTQPNPYTQRMDNLQANTIPLITPTPPVMNLQTYYSKMDSSPSEPLNLKTEKNFSFTRQNSVKSSASSMENDFLTGELNSEMNKCAYFSDKQKLDPMFARSVIKKFVDAIRRCERTSKGVLSDDDLVEKLVCETTSSLFGIESQPLDSPSMPSTGNSQIRTTGRDSVSSCDSERTETAEMSHADVLSFHSDASTSSEDYEALLLTSPDSDSKEQSDSVNKSTHNSSKVLDST